MIKLDRNPKSVLDAICKVWKKYPDLRVGQIISNAITPGDEGYEGDLLFYVENQGLADLILNCFEAEDD